MKILVSSTLALSLSLAIGAAQAEELSGTLKKVADNGTITLGYRDASVPFSYLGDNSGQPMGYSVELADKVVERLKSTLGKPELKVKYNLVTSQTRIPLVQNGTVDLECGSTGVTAERQKQVAFSYGFIYVKGQLLTRKDSGIAHFDDLKGKNVVTTAGTTNERYLKNYNAEHKLGMNVVSAKDHGEAFQMLQSGRAVAFYMDDALLYGERAKARQPTGWWSASRNRGRSTAAWCARTTRSSLPWSTRPWPGCIARARYRASTSAGSSSRSRPRG